MIRPSQQNMDLRFDPTSHDLRQQRPYYLVPLLDLDTDQTRRNRVQQAILAEVAERQQDEEGITDIYLFSHGWHRNLFSGVAAYDRIFSRFLMLLRRGRIEPALPFHPLFIAFHWHSDPGVDAWVDKDGRRTKSSFMDNIQVVFEPGGILAEFLNDFEEIYELFSNVSAPDTALQDPDSNERAKVLTARLEGHHLRGVLDDARVDRNATLPGEKAMLAWRCYEEAEAKRFLVDQADRPNRFNNPLLALSTLLKFVVSAVGLVTLLTFLLTNTTRIWSNLSQWVSHGWPKLKDHVHGHPRVYWPLNWLIDEGQALSRLLVALFVTAQERLTQHHTVPSLFASLFLSTVVIPAILLAVSIFWFQALRRFRSSGVPLVAMLAWVPLQLILVLPILAVAASTFIFRTWLILFVPVLARYGLLNWAQGLFWACVMTTIISQFLRLPLMGLFSERRDRHLLTRLVQRGVAVRDWLAALARLPIFGLRLALAQDSRVNGIADALENQLAFFEMQRNGVQAGIEASDFTEQLIAADLSLADARLHLIGHSFGGLVMANLARHLTRPVQTLCLIQAAIASAWFEGEEDLCSRIRGAIACIYSGYDTANGFYYPLANGGRLAAGYVGLCNLPPKNRVQPVTLGKDGLFASLSEPPKLNEVICRELQRTSKQNPASAWHAAVNLDASRLIYEGNPSSGGGHDDIFKDDVIHLIWAATEIQITPESCPPAGCFPLRRAVAKKGDKE